MNRPPGGPPSSTHRIRRKCAACVLASDTGVMSALNEIAGPRGIGQRAEPRRIHPFPARMPLSIASHLIKGLTAPDAIVADPMCGSGTTLLAASRLGRRFRGFDRDPLAVLISRTLVAAAPAPEVYETGQLVLKRAFRRHSRCGQRDLERFLHALPSEDAAFLRSWFPVRSLSELLALRHAIDEIPAGPEHDLLSVAFSGLIIAKTSGVSYARDITRSRPHRVQNSPVRSPFAVWESRLRQVLSRLPFADQDVLIRGDIRIGDARSLDLPRGSVDFLLTSPPYRTAIDYLRTHKFSLIWMGHRLADLRETRGTMIGTERGLWERDGLPDRLERRLTTHVTDPAPRARLRRYLSDLRQVLGETERVLKPGGLAVFAVGPTFYRKTRTDAAEIVGALGDAAGLVPIAEAVRLLPDFARSLPPPRLAVRATPLARRMRREVFVALRKPGPEA